MTYEKDAPRLLDHVTAQRMAPCAAAQQTLLSADDDVAAAELLEIVPRAGGRRLNGLRGRAAACAGCAAGGWRPHNIFGAAECLTSSS